MSRLLKMLHTQTAVKIMGNARYFTIKFTDLFLHCTCIKLHSLVTLSLVCVCVYSNSRNDVHRVAQRYGTIAAHTRRRASVLVAITDRHSDTTIFQLRDHWVRMSWSIGSEKLFGHVPPMGVESSTSCVQGEHPVH